MFETALRRLGRGCDARLPLLKSSKATLRRRLPAPLLTAAFAIPPPSLLQEKCKGTRQESKDAEEVKQR